MVHNKDKVRAQRHHRQYVILRRFTSVTLYLGLITCVIRPQTALASIRPCKGAVFARDGKRLALCKFFGFLATNVRSVSS